MNNVLKLALLGAAVVMSGCVVNDTEMTTTPTNSAKLFNKAKVLVADRMRDPEATRFKDDFAAYTTNTGDEIVCGTVNAKNAMGGYVGYKTFYVRMSGNTVKAWQMASEDDEYGMQANAIINACNEAASGKIMTMG